MTKSALLTDQVVAGTPGHLAPTEGRALSSDRRSLAVAAGLALAVFALAWWRHDSFRSDTLDLAVFDQAIWKMAHFKSPEVSTIGWNAFADHLSPVLVVFVPLYWLAATPLWLFAAQGIALGVGYLALGPALQAMGVPRRYFGPFAVAYLASPLLWNAALYDFHPTTLAVPVILIGLRAAFRDDSRTLVLSSLGLLFLRDDLGLVVAAMALFGFQASGREGRRTRLALVVGGLAWMGVASALASALGSDRHWTFHYGYLASSPTEAVLHPLRSVVRLFLGMARRDNVALVVIGYLAPLGFLPILRPARLGLVMLVALPLLASQGEHFHSPIFHYGAYTFPLLLAVAATGFARLAGNARCWNNPLLLAGGAVALLVAVGPFGYRNLTKPTIAQGDAERALSLVQPHDRVVATDRFGPHLSQRETLRIFPFPLADVTPGFPLTPEAKSVSAEAIAGIDIIVIHRPLYEEEAPAHEAFATSTYLDQFPFVRHFGDVTVYRRSPPPVGPGDLGDGASASTDSGR